MCVGEREEMVVYASTEDGRKMCGAWDKSGRLRFKELRAKIKNARCSSEAQDGEKQCMKRLFKKHGMQKKLDGKKKKAKPSKVMDLSGAEVGYGSGDEDEGDVVEYDREEQDGDSGADDSDNEATVGMDDGVVNRNTKKVTSKTTTQPQTTRL